MANKNEQRERMRRYSDLIHKEAGRAIRPQRFDGFVNLMNKYGTPKDTQEYYQFAREPMIPDERLISFYEGNGLFARIIDAPAEEAVRHGFELEDISDEDTIKFYKDALDELDWEERCMTALKWCRLFGGSIAVMLIDDGRGLEEPLDWENIRSIDDIRIYDRSVIQPDVTSMYKYDPVEPFGLRGSRLGLPEYYNVYSRYGSFVVHDSRVLVFQNGILPEYTQNSIYQMWGIPEYLRIHRAIRDSEIAHGTAPKMLDKSVQAVYKMKGLSALMATEDGENQALRRLQTIDMSRGLMNSILLDGDGEEYDFKSFSFSGVDSVINTTCNYLSALTNIPQTILFGRSPSGMNSTGDADFENYYNFIERIQKRVLRKNLRYLLSIIFRAGKRSHEIDEIPTINIKFNPLWSMSETEQVQLELQKLQVEGQRAQVAATYMQMGIVDAKEIRKKLAEQETYDVETMLNDMYDSIDELMENMPQQQQGGDGGQGGAPGGGAPGGGGDNPLGALMAGGGGGAPDGGGAPGGNPLGDMMGGGGEDKAQGDDMMEAEGTGELVTEDEIELATAIAMEDGDSIDMESLKPNAGLDDDTLDLAMAIELENGETAEPIPNTRKSKAKKVEIPEDEIELAQAIDMQAENEKVEEQAKGIEDKEKEKAEERHEKMIDIAADLAKVLRREKYKEEHPYDYVHKKETMMPADQNKWAENISNKYVSEGELEAARAMQMVDDETPKPSNVEFPQPGGNFLQVETNDEFKHGTPVGEKARPQPVEIPVEPDFITVDLVQTIVDEGAKDTDGIVNKETGGLIRTVSEVEKPSPTPQQKSDKINVNESAQKLFAAKREAREKMKKEREAEMALKKELQATEMEIAQAIDIQNSMRTDANDPVKVREFNPNARDENVRLYPEKKDGVKSVGVIVVKDGQVLVGKRNTKNGYGLICSGGGHVEDGETPEEAARRELTEEFGIKPKNMVYIGRGHQDINARMQPNIYLCNEFTGEPECDEVEMVDPVFMGVDELNLKENRQNMFPPFRSAFDLFLTMLKDDFDWHC